MNNKGYSRHQSKVEAISKEIGRLKESSEAWEFWSLDKRAVSHMAPQPDNPRYSDNKIDVSSLNEIIEIDMEKRICVAESGVKLEKLVQETLKFGLVPMCVSELKDISIGGAVAGCSAESMSFKYGGFHDSCLEYEIITGEGEIITCSVKHKRDIFEMMHSSFGTLGILTLLTFKLIPAKDYVKIEYQKYSDYDSYMSAIWSHYKQKDVEMMDGIIHSKDEYILCIGSFVDEVPYLSDYSSQPYYRGTREEGTDYLKTADYFFRFDSDCHWCMRNFGLENRFARKLLGKTFLGSTNILKMGERFPSMVRKKGRPDVVLDIFIPMKNAKVFYEWYLDTFNDYFPLWIVPYYIEKDKLWEKSFYPWMNPDMAKGIDEPLYINFAIYGFQQKAKGINYYRLLEDKVYELKGIKALIAHNYYDEDLFWKCYNKDLYNMVKAETDPDNFFRNLYNKVNYYIDNSIVKRAG